MHVLFVLLETALQILMPQVYSEIIITINCNICLVAKGEMSKDNVVQSAELHTHFKVTLELYLFIMKSLGKDHPPK